MAVTQRQWIRLKWKPINISRWFQFYRILLGSFCWFSGWCDTNSFPDQITIHTIAHNRFWRGVLIMIIMLLVGVVVVIDSTSLSTISWLSITTNRYYFWDFLLHKQPEMQSVVENEGKKRKEKSLMLKKIQGKISISQT